MDLSIISIFSMEEKYILHSHLRALEASCDLLDYEIILVNNSNEKLNFLMETFKNVSILNNKRNVGVAKARNQGAGKARANTIFFIDLDIIVQKETIKRMYSYLCNNPEVHGLAPKLILPDGELQYNFGPLPSLIYPACEIFCISINKRRKAEAGLYPFLGFGCLMLRRDAWLKTGGFDEKFFYGFEDTDWCNRAQSKGIKLLYYPKLHVLHLLHQSVKGSGGRQVDFYISEVYYYKKHHGKFLGVLVKFFIIIFSLLRLIISFFKPQRTASTRHLLKRLIKNLIKI
jgi:GT2 family glycosyltransferase